MEEIEGIRDINILSTGLPIQCPQKSRLKEGQRQGAPEIQSRSLTWVTGT